MAPPSPKPAKRRQKTLEPANTLRWKISWKVELAPDLDSLADRTPWEYLTKLPAL